MPVSHFMTTTRPQASAPTTERRANRRRQLRSGGITRYLFVGSIVAALLVIIVSAMTMLEARRDTWDRAHRSAENLLQGVIGYMDQHMRLYMLALDFAAETLHGPDTAALSEEAKARVLASIVNHTDYVGSVIQLDASGDLVRSSPPAHTQLNLADRDYFIAQRDHPRLGVYISQPFRSRLRDSDPSIALSRRLNNPDGSFAGVVVIAVRLAYIDGFLSGIDTGPNGALLVLSDDGHALIQHPPGNGRGAAGTRLFQRMLQTGSGSMVEVDPVDGVERYNRFARVPGQPLVIDVALATQDVFGAWRHRSIIIGSLTLITCALMVVLAVLLRRELHRRAAIEAHLAHLSITDGLTGLLNRRRYDEMLEREWRRTARTGSSLALLLIDTDHFKRLNDRYGHAIGDEVLRQLAATLSACIRQPGDLAARYGGEEFTVLLPDATPAQAVAVAERIRSACEQLDAGLPPFTVSIGVAVIHPSPAGSTTEFQERADKALYRAKATGRNRVVSDADT
ncbi:diguanylate cyclase (GGDEF)-like protein [Paraburkholderia caballeronis]|nr:diguanylate cyclase (GGDEF)-like protein [Paraburkholderia caballeronis]TDV22324.1 diguanylate cyclase (GGDEF)-like protein [Paraburkholderia caballeronis]TDV29228.1 diguanylate cyclase (GGDEF)-like protein [Paraburkholderia caballeronis]